MGERPLTIRLSEGERAGWEAAAGPMVPLGRWVRQLVNEEVRRRAGAVLAERDSGTVEHAGEPGRDTDGSMLARVRAEVSPPDLAAVSSRSASAARFDGNCSNSRYHQEGKVCRWCGGER